MPRPKRTTSNTSTNKYTKDNDANYNGIIELQQNALSSTYATNLLELERDYEHALVTIAQMEMYERMNITPVMGNKTMGVLRAEKLNGTSFSTTFYDSTSLSKFLDSTRKNNTKNISAQKKQKHFTDEARTRLSSGASSGYLTAESTRAASSDRAEAERNRPIKKDAAKTGRSSRSLSKSRMERHVTIQAPDKATPAEKRTLPIGAGYGFVTPKVKPNTPLTVLRRPKQGEMAISMQGSPLMVSGVMSEDVANVNIPLNDGRIMSIQPSNSIRMSQLPNLDDNTIMQLTKLRDNINRVCQMTNANRNE